MGLKYSCYNFLVFVICLLALFERGTVFFSENLRAQSNSDVVGSASTELEARLSRSATAKALSATDGSVGSAKITELRFASSQRCYGGGQDFMYSSYALDPNAILNGVPSEVCGEIDFSVQSLNQSSMDL